VDKAIVAGHSMGGYVTLKLLQDHPERVERAILLHSNPWADAPEKAADREREKALIRENKLMALASYSIPRMYYEENLRDCDEKIRETVELCETHDPEGIIASIEGLRTRPDLQSVMTQLPAPLLVIHGDHDTFLPLERVEEMKKLFPKVQYQLIPETGHNSFIERPDATLAALIQWAAPQS
jgi:pimeloyl-ACP methyl ester carboxylesterase